MKKSAKRTVIKYDTSSDVLYIATRKGLEQEVAEIAPGIAVELDKSGNVLGVEILRASRTLKGFLKALESKRHVAA
jgi:uncharacterized protein YuzE